MLVRLFAHSLSSSSSSSTASGKRCCVLHRNLCKHFLSNLLLYSQENEIIALNVTRCGWLFEFTVLGIIWELSNGPYWIQRPPHPFTIIFAWKKLNFTKLASWSPSKFYNFQTNPTNNFNATRSVQKYGNSSASWKSETSGHSSLFFIT